jgi:hypothetical protein
MKLFVSVNYEEEKQASVELMLDYPLAWRMPTLKHVEACVDMMTDAKHFIIWFIVNVMFKIFHHVM